MEIAKNIDNMPPAKLGSINVDTSLLIWGSHPQNVKKVRLGTRSNWIKPINANKPPNIKQIFSQFKICFFSTAFKTTTVIKK